MRGRAGAALVAIVGMLCWASPPLPASEDHEAARELVIEPGSLPAGSELEILTERGEVLEVLYDARNGTLIKAEQED